MRNVAVKKIKVSYVFCLSFFLALYVSFIVLQSSSSEPWNSTVEVDFGPKVLNLRSEGDFVTCFLMVIEENYGVEDVDVSSIRLLDVIPANWSKIAGKRLMIKFDRGHLTNLLGRMLQPEPYAKFKYVDLKVTGTFDDGTTFMSFDRIKIIFM